MRNLSTSEKSGKISPVWVQNAAVFVGVKVQYYWDKWFKWSRFYQYHNLSIPAVESSAAMFTYDTSLTKYSSVKVA